VKPEIKHIIFDLGGVILNIDYAQTAQAFKQLGFTDFDELYTQFKQSALFVQLEKGLISPEAFLAELKNHGRQQVANQPLIDAWNAMLLDLPVGNLRLLERLQTQYRLFLLSNTNAIHYQHFFDQVAELTGRRDLSPYFEQEYYSHLIGKRKPDAAVFKHIIDDRQIEPGNTLVIDDSPQHLTTAEALGFQTVLKQDNVDLAEALGVKWG